MKLSGWTRLWIVASVIWWAAGALWLTKSFQPAVEMETGLTVEGGPYALYREDWTPWLVRLAVVVTAPFLVAVLAYGFSAFKRLVRTFRKPSN